VPAFFNADVQLKLEIGFNSSGPTDTGFTWTDVSKYARDFLVTRGRAFELDDVAVGIATFTLSNSDRRFDPDSTGGAYQPNVKLRKPVRLQTIHSGTTRGLFYGYVNGWTPEGLGTNDQTMVLDVVDGFGVFGPWETATTGPSEVAHTRSARFLDAVGGNTDLRDLTTGGATMAAYSPACAAVLGEINRVAKTEAGMFFMDADGKAAFRPNGYRTGTTSAVTLTDTGGGLSYVQPLRKNYDISLVRNDVTVVGVGIASQASDSTASVDLYGRQKMKQFDTLHANATGARDTADGLRDKYATPVTRVPAVSMIGTTNTDTGLWPHLLGRELSDKIQLRYAGKSVTTGIYDADHHIEGITHSGRVGGVWETQWLLSPATE